MKIDDTTIALLKLLRQGRTSYAEIAKELSLAVNTVRSRIQRLAEEGVLDIAGLCNPEALPGHVLAVVGVKLKDMELVKKAEEFGKLRGVVSVGVVTGRFDLLVTVLLNEEFGLLQFLAQEAAGISGVPVHGNLCGLQGTEHTSPLCALRRLVPQELQTRRRSPCASRNASRGWGPKQHSPYLPRRLHSPPRGIRSTPSTWAT